MQWGLKQQLYLYTNRRQAGNLSLTQLLECSVMMTMINLQQLPGAALYLLFTSSSRSSSFTSGLSASAHLPIYRHLHRRTVA
jgi:hypothetical protein